MATSATLLEAFEIVNEIFDMPEAERQDVLARRCHGRADLLAEIQRIEAAPLTTRSVPRLAPVLEALLTNPDQASAHDHLTGATIGPYLVGEILGSGGMGHVYRAVHTGHSGAVALKVLQFRSDHFADRVRRLQHEAKLLARCHHPGIVQIYHLDRLPDSADPNHSLQPGAYFTMELVEGAPITAFCAEKSLSFKQRLELFLRVCEAVQAAHDVGVIHRDLKPSNILANSEGVKLLDFGVAEAFGEVDPRCRPYMSGAYAAPEHLDETTTRTDVYSLGVLLAELLLNRLPFHINGDTPAEQRRSILESQRPRLHRWARESTASHLRSIGHLRWTELQAIYEKATAFDSSVRYGAVQDLAADVHRLLQNRTVAACGASPRSMHALYTGLRFLGRNALYAAILSVGTLAAVAFDLKYTQALRRSNVSAQKQHHAEEVARRNEDLATTFIFQNDGSVISQNTAESLLEHAIHRAEIIHTDPDQLASLFKSYGADFEMVGDFDRADQLLGQSLRLNIQLHGADSAEVADVMLQRSALLSSEGKKGDALGLAQKARANLVRKLPASDLRVLEADDRIAQCLIDQGEYAAAKPMLETIVQREAIDPSAQADYSTALNDLSNLENYTGNYQRSLALQQQSMALDKMAEGTMHPDIGEHLLSIANLYMLLRDANHSVGAARDALKILSASLPAGHHDVHAAERQLAASLELAGKLQEAEPLFRKALADLAGEPERSRTELTALDGYGDLLRKLNRLPDALHIYERALSITRQLYPVPNHMWAAAYFGLGATNLLAGKLHDAETNSREALRLDQASFGISHTRTLQADVLLARVFIKEDKLDEARTLLQQCDRAPTTADPASMQVHTDEQLLLKELDTFEQNAARAGQHTKT